jgi:hypothetical protein
MFAVFRVIFDGGMCPGNSAPSREANRVLSQNFCQCVGELTAQGREISFRSHRFPPLFDRGEVTSKKLFSNSTFSKVLLSAPDCADPRFPKLNKGTKILQFK